MHDPVLAAAMLAVVYVALAVAHGWSDHWGQTHRQACAKGGPGRAGRLACLAHVATLTATKVGLLAVVAAVLGLELPVLATVAALLLDAVSHYWADRRVTLAALADAVGKGVFYRMGAPRPGRDDAPHIGTGAYSLDQSWHQAWLLVAALIIAAPSAVAPWVGAVAVLALAVAVALAEHQLRAERRAGPRCCGTSVGALIFDEAGRLLMVTRGWRPWGIAPVAGHAADEQQGGPMAALAAEIREEVGLVLGRAEMVLTGHRPNLCASRPNPVAPGHYWTIYRATATGTLTPAAGETTGAAWYTPGQVEALAQQTIDYAHGRVTDAEYEAQPGLEAVWVAHLAALGYLTVDEADLDAVEALYTTPPPQYWNGADEDETAFTTAA